MVGPELFEQHEVAGILHEDGIPGGKQDACEQIECLRGAECRQDVGRARRDAMLYGARNLLAQLEQSLWCALLPRLRPAAP